MIARHRGGVARSGADQTLGRTDYAYYLEQHRKLLGARSAEARTVERGAEAETSLPLPILRHRQSGIERAPGAPREVENK
jgi:hypothetical protein